MHLSVCVCLQVHVKPGYTVVLSSVWLLLHILEVLPAVNKVHGLFGYFCAFNNIGRALNDSNMCLSGSCDF